MYTTISSRLQPLQAFKIHIVTTIWMILFSTTASAQVHCQSDVDCVASGIVDFPRPAAVIGLNDRYVDRHAIDGEVILIGWPQEGTTETGFVEVYRFIEGNGWVLEDELSNRNSAPSDHYGEAVDASGAWAIVGVPNEERDPGGPALYKGAAYLFSYDAAQADWTEFARLSPPTITPFTGHGFGESVELEGNRALVGMSLWQQTIPSSSATGGVFIYEFDGLQWAQTALLEPPSEQFIFTFGQRIAAHGQRLIVGAPGSGDAAENETSRGSAFIYRYDEGSWIQEAWLEPDPPTQFGWFGQSVDICDGVAMVGQRIHDDTGFGAVHVYEFNGTDWIRRSVLQPDDLCPADSSSPPCDFSDSIALGYGVAVIGTPRADLSGQIDRGYVYVYRRDPLTGDWCVVQKISPSRPTSDPDPPFGLAVCMDKATERTLIGNAETAEGLANSTTLYRFNDLGPVIVAQPVPEQRLVGQSATFTVTAAEPPDLHQWRRNGVDLVDGGRITGALTASLTINDLVVEDGGVYDVRLVNACGATTSDAVLLDVEYPCPDGDSDNSVGVTDLLLLLGQWGICRVPCALDINDDFRVDVVDLLILLGRWGPC